jgi:hypothetical protein
MMAGGSHSGWAFHRFLACLFRLAPEQVVLPGGLQLCPCSRRPELWARVPSRLSARGAEKVEQCHQSQKHNQQGNPRRKRT